MHDLITLFLILKNTSFIGKYTAYKNAKVLENDYTTNLRLFWKKHNMTHSGLIIKGRHFSYLFISRLVYI